MSGCGRVVARGRAARALLALCALEASFGCASHVAAPPPAPAFAVERPGAAIPGDLDVALRLDLAGARRLFGTAFGHAVAFDITDRAADPKTAELIASGIARADAAWVAFRPGLSPSTTDNVLILRGEFAELEPHGPGSDWGAPVDLGAAMRLYQRRPPKRRSAPARIYARSDDWLVFVSNAEVDAAERSIERHSNDEHVDPPDHGVVSLAARARPLVRLLAHDYPAVAEALEDANTVEGSATADDRGLALDLSARFKTAADAVRAGDRTRLLLSVLAHAKGPFALLAQGATPTAVGTSLVVRVHLDAKALATIIGCLGGSEDC